MLENTFDCEQAIFDTYKPLIAIATYIGDAKFMDRLKTELARASESLRDGESYLEWPTYVKVFVGLAYDIVKDSPTCNPIGIELNRVAPAIQSEFGATSPALELSANQRNSILREHGLVIKSSHSRNRVFFTIPGLIALCDQFGVVDDQLDVWAKALNIKRVTTPYHQGEDSAPEEE